MNLGNPPIVVARPWSGADDKTLIVRRPIVIVDVKIRRRNLSELAGGDVQDSDPLVMNGGVDDTRGGGRGH